MAENDLSYIDKLKQAKTTEDIRNVLKDFFASAGFPNYNKEEWDTFVDNNTYAISIECDKYQLTLSNPFFQFLQTYLQKWGNIRPFMEQANYSVLHNCIAHDILTTKQLSFKAPENQQVTLLLNPHLWDIGNKDDVTYLIKVYVWFLEEDLDRFIKNAYVKAIFSRNIKRKVNGKTVDVLDLTGEKVFTNNHKAVVELIKLTLFTDLIIKLTEEGKKRADYTEAELEQVSQEYISKADSISINSSDLKSVDLIEEQLKYLNEYVQESERNASTGQYQETDTEGNDVQENGNRQQEVSRELRSLVNSKYADIKNFLSNTFQTNNKADIRDILTVLRDITVNGKVS